MKPDNFESRVQRQPLRQVPADWRAAILAAAEEMNARSSRAETSWWLAWMLPSRVGWAALGAAWLLIIGLSFSGPAESGPTSATAVAADWSRNWSEQRKMMAELIDAPTSPEPPPLNRPRSQRRMDAVFLCV